jgi:hypothetical protein
MSKKKPCSKCPKKECKDCPERKKSAKEKHKEKERHG